MKLYIQNIQLLKLLLMDVLNSDSSTLSLVNIILQTID